jgi:hypothetical protein
MHGEPVVVEGTELLARALQHETDHLNGILFIDRLSDADRKLAMKEIRESEWFGLAQGETPQIKVSPHNTFGKGLLNAHSGCGHSSCGSTNFGSIEIKQVSACSSNHTPR